jgi:hypothetical protein
MLLTAVLSIGCGPAPCPTVAVDGNPGDSYLFAYTEQRYDAGPWELHPSSGHVAGSVYFPVQTTFSVEGPTFVSTPNPVMGGSGPLPLVLLVHGHTLAPAASYLGYSYLQAALAANGMIAVSPRMDVLDNQILGDDEWADRILRTVQYFLAQNATPGSVFFQRIDFGRVGLMGHSRGGGAISKLPGLLPAGVTVGAVLMLATDATPPWIAGVPVLSILPAAEGIGGGEYDPFTPYPGAPGYPDLPAARSYDQRAAVPFKVQLYVDNANHSRWNRAWTESEGAPTPSAVMGRPNHELILRAYGTAFFKAFLREWALLTTDHARRGFLRQSDGAMGYLNGRQKPRLHRNADPTGGSFPEVNVDPNLLHLSWLSQYSLVVDDHEGGEGIVRNRLGGAITSDGLTLDESQVSSGDGYAGATRMLFADQVSCDPLVVPCSGYLRSELPPAHRDVSARASVTVRVGEVYRWSDPLPAAPLAFDLGLETGSGQVQWVPSSVAGGVPRPYLRGDRAQRFVLTTLRFYLRCFDEIYGQLDDIVAIRLRPQNLTGRRIAFDDLVLE